MFAKHPWFETATVDTLYSVYEEALQELRRHSKETSWEGSDKDMLVLATRILDLAFLGERDVIKLRRGAMFHFGYVELGDPDRSIAAA